MFPMLGIAEVLALLAIGMFLAPLILRPFQPDAVVLFPRRFELDKDGAPAVLIESPAAAIATALLALRRVEPVKKLEAGAYAVTFHIQGVSRGCMLVLDVARVVSTGVVTSYPLWKVLPFGFVGFVALAYVGAGRLTLPEIAGVLVFMALVVVVAALQATNDLVIGTANGRSLVMAFSARRLGRKPAVSRLQLEEAAHRIIQLAIQARRGE